MIRSRLELNQVAKKTSSMELVFSFWSCRNTNYERDGKRKNHNVLTLNKEGET